MATIIKDEFFPIFEEVRKELIKDDSLYKKHLEEVNEIAGTFGLTHIEKSKMIAEFILNFARETNNLAITATMKIIDGQQKEEINEKNKAKIDAEILNIDEKTILIKKQQNTEDAQTLLVNKQTALVQRQERGYGDNMLIKAAEFEGSLASFAVNAGSDSAQDTIEKFNTTVSSVKGRA